MVQSETRNVDPERLSRLAQGILAGSGLTEDQAALVAESLVEADLRGVRSHGVMRVPQYSQRIAEGNINAHPSIDIVVDSGATLVVDGDGGMGQVSAARAMQLAIDRSQETGIATVGVRNSRHAGTMAYWAMMALPTGCIGFAACNAGMNMAPWGAKDRIVGNNPFGIAVPTRRPWAMVLDMATSVAAGGKLDMAALQNKPIPLGWALGPDGNPTEDPQLARRGTLLPVGGPKGYGLALMVDVLAGVLTATRFGGNLGVSADLGSTVQGHFFAALKVESFMPLGEFYDRMDAMIDQIHGSALAPGFERIYVPGEIEHNLKEKHLAEGLPIETNLLDRLAQLAEQFAVDNLPDTIG